MDESVVVQFNDTMYSNRGKVANFDTKCEFAQTPRSEYDMYIDFESSTYVDTVVCAVGEYQPKHDAICWKNKLF